MLMRKKMLGMATAAVFMTAVVALPQSLAAKETPADTTVVAIVNGDKITKGDVMGIMKNLSIPQADTEKAFPLVVDQIINEKLIDSETLKAKIQDSADFKTRLEAMKVQLEKQMYIENFLKDKLTDKTVKAEYGKIKKAQDGKQEVHARHILVATEEEAKQVIKDLDAGKKFEELAAERSSGPTAKNGGDVGFFAKEDMLAEFSDAAFALKPGTYSKTPVKTQFGWHVIKVDEKRARKVPEMKELEAGIRNQLGQQAIQQLVTDLRAKAEIQRFNMDGTPVKEETKKN